VTRKAAFCTWLAATILIAVRATAGPAMPPNPRAYALLIGSNPGGAGQDTLRFAESDARRVRQVLTELGGYAPQNVTLLVHPGTLEVRDALDELRARVEADHARGHDATLFFYYSGHARASAMNLGDATLELADLRARLTALPTALTIVVLDACQSGAFERVKGAAAAQDFSFNSVTSLDTRGLAVMASSSSAELSQESERLRSSYFTHYLLMALRGAGDQNGDGRVSLDEAYRYAYAETLGATARTRVGGQHVTLETKLTGRGDVAVTYPANESSQFLLPDGFQGQILLQTAAHHAVVAEVTKVKGAPLRLALPPAAYEAVVRKNGSAWECKIDLKDSQTTTLDLKACQAIAQDEAQAKGESAASFSDSGVTHSRLPDPDPSREMWSIEAALGGGPLHDDDYVAQLSQFGYGREQDLVDFGPSRVDWSVSGSRRIAGAVSALVRVRQLDQREFFRYSADSNTQHTRSFGWTSYGFSFGARATWEGTEAFGLYGQVELGPALAVSKLDDSTTNPIIHETETYWGFLTEAAVGLQMNAWRYGGLFLEGDYAYAPVVKDLIGDTHDSGGFRFLVGIRARIWGKP
jgi:hypothetical protein